MKINYFETAVKHHKDGNWNKAKEIYEHILKQNPENFIVLQNYGSLLAKLREYKQAKNIFEKCLKIKPNDFLVLYNLGKFYQEMKIFDKAVPYYEKSYNIEPKKNLSMYNIGNIYLQESKFIDAINYFKKSIDTNPKNFYAYNNIGLAYKKMGNFNEAIKYYKSAIDINNNYVDGHTNYATMLLTMNKLELGFEEYEWRKKSKVFSDYLNYKDLSIKSPIWNGEKISGQKILILSEQGIGDLIQFSRYLFVLRDEYNCKVILRLKQNLSHFFKEERDIKIISEEDKILEHNFHNHLASLPGIIYKKNKKFPKTVKFIKENQKLDEKWKNILSKYKGLKIGINSHSTATVGERIIPIENFNYLTDLSKVKFFIIQKDFDKKKMNIINNNSNVTYFEDIDKNVKPFEDTISIIKNLDLVITADTAVAHLSATLGKKTWVILTFVSDWRWFTKTKNSDWYPTVTLYRQNKIGEWTSIFKTIEGDLNSYIKLLNN